MSQQSLSINGVEVGNIVNRNEKRVAALVPGILEEYFADFIFEDLDIQDIYGLALNLLPAAYAQPGSIVLSNRLSDYEIRSKIRVAVERVLSNPTRAGE